MAVKDETFEAWVSRMGGEVLAPTSEWELYRIRAGGKTLIVYRTKHERIRFSSRAAQHVYEYWQEGKDHRLGNRVDGYKAGAPVVRALTKRDGPWCFYCGTMFSEQVRPTIEHLVARNHNGPDHVSNKFLACQRCNHEAGHLSAPEKIRLRDRKLFGAKRTNEHVMP